ncbi:MAG: hypothetical protein GF350_15225 [Chitinivibrionales bacterium]|nr:hypothetical protein [Chitinivibrionales bacterium]
MEKLMTVEMKKLIIKKTRCILLFVLLLGAAVFSGERVFTDEEVEANVPHPVSGSHPEWVEMYWEAWRKVSSSSILHTASRGALLSPLYFDENLWGGRNWIFQWDTCLMMMFGRYGFKLFPTLESLDNFYRLQATNGYISRKVEESTGQPANVDTNVSSANPPLFAWAEWEHYLVSHNVQRFSVEIRGFIDGEKVPLLQRIVNHYDWLKESRRHEDGFYWSTGYASGMDNTPRLGVETGHSHAGGAWVDLTAQQALNALMISKIAEKTGNDSLHDAFVGEYQALKQVVNDAMWHTQDAFYYDLDSSRKFSRIKTTASFWPLCASIADSAQCVSLIKHLLDTNEFMTPHTVPTLSKDHPLFEEAGEYWRGGVWSPTNYMVMKGLQKNDRHDIARLIAANHLENVYKVWKETGDPMWETYAPLYGMEGSISTPTYGWSALGPIACLIEYIIGIEPTDSNTLIWHIEELGEHGVDHYHFGTNVIDVRCSPRAHPAEWPTIRVTCNEPFRLIVKCNSQTAMRNFPAGQSEWNTENEMSRGIVHPIRGAVPDFSNCIRITSLNNAHIRIPAVCIRYVVYTIQGRKLCEMQIEPGKAEMPVISAISALEMLLIRYW